MRLSVRENRLISVVLSEHDYVEAIEKRGCGWVVEQQGVMWPLLSEIRRAEVSGRCSSNLATREKVMAAGYTKLWLRGSGNEDTIAYGLHRTALAPSVSTEKLAGSEWEVPNGEVRYELKRPNEHK